MRLGKLSINCITQNKYQKSIQQTYDSHRLRLNLMSKMYLRRGDKRAVLSNLSIYYT